MKNSEFINLMIATDKIKLEDCIWTTDVDKSIFNMKEYYIKYKDKFEGEDSCDVVELFNFLSHFTIKNDASNKKLIVDEWLDFLLNMFTNKKEYAKILSILHVSMIGDMYRINYSGIFGQFIEINNDRLRINYMRYNNRNVCNIYGVNTRRIYDEVLCIEKDLKTKKIDIIEKSNNTQKNKKALSIEKDKLKVVFKDYGE